MKFAKLLFIAILALVVLAGTAGAQEQEGGSSSKPTDPQRADLHQYNSKGPWCVSSELKLFGLVQDSTTQRWAWYSSVEVMFLHVTPPLKKPSVRLLGIAVGLAAFSGSGNGYKNTLVVTLIPVKVGRVSVGVTPYRPARFYEAGYNGPRYRNGVMLTVSVY